MYITHLWCARMNFFHSNVLHAAGALRLARETLFTDSYGDRANHPNLIILISDGMSNTDPELTIPEAQLNRERDIRIISIGMYFFRYDFNVSLCN